MYLGWRSESIQRSNFTTATMANAVTSSTFAVMPVKFGLYWWQFNVVPFSPLALVPKKVLVEKNLVYLSCPLSILSFQKISKENSSIHFLAKDGGTPNHFNLHLLSHA